MALIRNPDRGEFTGAQKLRQAHGVAPVGFDAITRLLRDQRRRHHVARMTEARNLPVKPIAGRPRFVAECQPLVLAGKFAHQLRRRLRGVLDLTKKSHFAIAPNIRDRDRITQLRGIKTHKSFAMLAHDSPSLLEALPGPFRVTLATASRVSRLRKGRDIQSEEPCAAQRLEGWPLAQLRPWLSFETPAFGRLLRYYGVVEVRRLGLVCNNSSEPRRSRC